MVPDASCLILLIKIRRPDNAPDLSMHPVNVESGEQFTVTISTPVGVIFPFCNGVIYELQQFGNGEWQKVRAGRSTSIFDGKDWVEMASNAFHVAARE
jgi:hypothetical protein